MTENGNGEVEPKKEEKVESKGEDAADENADRRAVAQEVVGYLHEQYNRIHERQQDYFNLFCFLAFGVLWLTMLFLQRDTKQCYNVQVALNAHLLPEETELASLSAIEDWVGNTVSEIWKDPVCGDGLCELPWEHWSYSRFGCKADCGQLIDQYELTTLQLDLAWDFTHVGGTPSTDLMAGASWNLCPSNDKPSLHGSDCYYEEDQSFEAISGSCYGEQCPSPLLVEDVPSGDWVLRIKGDLFNKVSGAIRSYNNVTLEGTEEKVRLALEAARSMLVDEALRLRNATTHARMTRSQVILAYRGQELAVELRKLDNSNDNATVKAAKTIVLHEEYYSELQDILGCEGLTQPSNSSAYPSWTVDTLSLGAPAAPYPPPPPPPLAASSYGVACAGGVLTAINVEVSDNRTLAQLAELKTNGTYTQADGELPTAATVTISITYDPAAATAAGMNHTIVLDFPDSPTGSSYETEPAMLKLMRGSSEGVGSVFLDYGGALFADLNVTGVATGAKLNAVFVLDASLAPGGAGSHWLLLGQSPSYYCDAKIPAPPELVCEGLKNRTIAYLAAHDAGIRLTLLERTAKATESMNANLTAGLDLVYKADKAKCENDGVETCLYTLHKQIVSATGKSPDKVHVASAETLMSNYQEALYRSAKTTSSFEDELITTVINGGRVVTDAGSMIRPPATLLELAVSAEGRAAELDAAKLNVTLLASTQQQYDYMQWPGGRDQFMKCRIAARAPQYVGVCLADGAIVGLPPDTDNTEIPVGPGKLFNRVCNAICDCATALEVDEENTGMIMTQRRPSCGCRPEKAGETSACSELTSLPPSKSLNETCVCSACVPNQYEIPPSATGEIAPSVIPYRRRSLLSADNKHEGRRLMQSDGVTQLVASVDRLSASQGALEASVTNLKGEVVSSAESNEVAQRDMEARLKQSMDRGWADLKAGQAAIQVKLDEIIGKQNQALAAVERAAEAQKRMAALQEQQAEQQAAINKAVQSQLEKIEAAQKRGAITSEQMLKLQQDAKVNQNRQNKRALLANLPCSVQQSEYNFKTLLLDGSEPVEEHLPRFRMVGLTNRIVAGMLFYTERTRPVKCDDKRFLELGNECSGPKWTKAYGVDPAFKAGAALYQPDLDTEADVVRIYNCTGGYPDGVDADGVVRRCYRTTTPENPAGVLSPECEGTYRGRYNGDEGNPSNQFPYCEQLFNKNNVPYGFFSKKLKVCKEGCSNQVVFPFFYDINLSEENFGRYLDYMKDGLYLDGNTASVTAQVVTYNSELKLFGNMQIFFVVGDGGLVSVSHSTKVLDVELYVDKVDYFRGFLEGLVGLMILFAAYNELKELHTAKKVLGAYSKYFTSVWNYIDLLNIALMLFAWCNWWMYVALAYDFDAQARYNVYRSLHAPAGMLEHGGDPRYCGLEGDEVVPDAVNCALTKGKPLTDLVNVYAAITQLTDALAMYYAVAGVNIMLYLLRVLKLMHFQPRLGVVTRTLILAASDLFHFFILFFVIFFGYAGLGHLVFGNSVQAFSTIEDSIMTCFEFLLGEIGVKDDLKALTSWSKVSGLLFFWSYAILVFIILLNFVLAIIVDAYSEVKAESQETVGILTEVGEIVGDSWRKNLKRFGLYKSYVANDRVRTLLEAWVKGMSIEELEAEHAREEAEGPVEKEVKLRVDGKEVDEDELAEMLASRLEDHSIKKSQLGKKPGESITDIARRAAQTIIGRFGKEEEDGEEEEEEEEDKQAELEELAKQVLEEQQQLAKLQESILRQQSVILQAVGHQVQQQQAAGDGAAAAGGTEGFTFDVGAAEKKETPKKRFGLF